MGFGSALGGLLGSIGSDLFPIAGVNGGQLGSMLGGLTGFKHGGAVKRTGKFLIHQGEFVLPKSVKPTKAQRAAVAKLKRDAKKGKK